MSQAQEAYYRLVLAPEMSLADLIRLLVDRDLWEWQAAMNNRSLPEDRRVKIAHVYLKACVVRDNFARTPLTLDDNHADLIRLLFRSYLVSPAKVATLANLPSEKRQLVTA